MTQSFILQLIVGPFLAGLSSAAVPLDSLSQDEAAVAAYVKALRNEQSEVRAAAAEALRLIVAKSPSRTVYVRGRDDGEARWTEKVNQVKPGMSRAQVHKILPPFPDASERMNMASGQRNWDTYRLDYHWIVRVVYDNPDKVSDRPTLIQRAMRVHVEPPKNYTGTWTTWHVNGQKSYESQYRNGKYDGVHTCFHDNGRKSYEQHYANHVADGADTGWYTDGKTSYMGRYRNGKQDGQWVHWHSNGQKQSESSYVNGKYDGVCARWHLNGQLTSLEVYRNGVKHGLEAAWDEKGILQYKRYYANGNIVDP